MKIKINLSSANNLANTKGTIKQNGFSSYVLSPVGAVSTFEERFDTEYNSRITDVFSNIAAINAEADNIRNSIAALSNNLTTNYLSEATFNDTATAISMASRIAESTATFATNEQVGGWYGLNIVNDVNGVEYISGFDMGAIADPEGNDSYFRISADKFIVGGDLGDGAFTTMTGINGEPIPAFAIEQDGSGNPQIYFNGKVNISSIPENLNKYIGEFEGIDALNAYLTTNVDVIVNAGDTYLNLADSTVYTWTGEVWLSTGAETRFWSIVFTRTANQPATPTTGTFDNPVPSGWQDSIPPFDPLKDAQDPLWATMAQFSNKIDYTENPPVWTIPVIWTDSETTDIMYNSSILQPSNPVYTGDLTTVQSTDAANGWYNTPDATSIWAAWRVKKLGTWSAWSVYKVRGENGADGADGDSAYAIWLSEGNTGTTLDFINALRGADGTDGADGIPGVDGADGITYYTWIKYADSSDGTVGFSNNPADKSYIGLAFNKDTQVESENASDYAWSLIKGADGIDGYTPVKGIDYFDGVDGTDGSDGDSAYTLWLAEGNTGTTLDFLNSLIGRDGIDGSDGLPGTPGVDGITYYTWIKYADSADGSVGFTNTSTDKAYIGFAFNKDTAVESENYQDYTWSLIKGADGVDGVSGSSSDIVFKRESERPATPTSALTYPSTWETDIGNVKLIHPSTGALYSDMIVTPHKYVVGTSTAAPTVNGRLNISNGVPSVGSTVTMKIFYKDYDNNDISSLLDAIGAGETVSLFITTTEYTVAEVIDAAYTYIVDKSYYTLTVKILEIGTINLNSTMYFGVYKKAPIWGSHGIKDGSSLIYTWNTPTIITQVDSPIGVTVVEVTVFQRALSAPSTPIGGAYDISTASFNSLPTGWSNTLPTGTEPAWMSKGVVVGNNEASITWYTPTKLAENGVDGTTVYTDFVFSQNSTAPTLSDFSVSGNGDEPVIVYNGAWKDNASDLGVDLSAVNIYTVKIKYHKTAANDSWEILSLGTPSLWNGTNGVDGNRGSAILTGTATTASEFSSAFTAEFGNVINGDQYISSTSNGTLIYTYNGTVWQNNTTLQVHGDAVINGTLSADKLAIDSIIGKRIEMDSTTAYSTQYFTDDVFGSQSTAFSFKNTNRAYGVACEKTNSGNGSALYALCSNAGQTGAAVVGINQSTSATAGWGGYFVSSGACGLLARATSTGRAGIQGYGTIGVQGIADTSTGYGLYTGQKTYSYNGYSPFTGSHITFSKDTLSVGQIVSSDDAWVLSIDNTLIHTSATKVAKDKKVIGVVSSVDTNVLRTIQFENSLYDIERNADGFEVSRTIKAEYQEYIDTLVNDGYKEVEINSVGEGGILVSNANGNIENGDYLVSDGQGYAMKQDDDVLHNYTVGKALESVSWADEDGATTKMIACTYHCG